MQLTLSEYASKIGAELKPTSLSDMPIMEYAKSSGNYFAGLGIVNEWLKVKDPSGGVNKTGLWPFSVQELGNGELVIVASGY